MARACATSWPREERDPDNSLRSSEKRDPSGDSLPAPMPMPTPIPAAVATPTVPTVPAPTECPPGSGPGHGGTGVGMRDEREPCKLEVRDPWMLPDSSLKWKVRPVTGLWPEGLGTSGVKQGEALADPYWAREARAERSHRGRKLSGVGMDDDGAALDEPYEPRLCWCVRLKEDEEDEERGEPSMLPHAASAARPPPPPLLGLLPEEGEPGGGAWTRGLRPLEVLPAAEKFCCCCWGCC